MNSYYLMNKNSKIALLDCVDDTLYIRELYTDRLPIIINNIDKWIHSRTNIINRRIQEIIQLVKDHYHLSE